MFTHNNLHPGGNHYDTVLLNADNRKWPCDGPRWFKLKKMSKCQKDVKMSKRCQMSKSQAHRLWRRFTKKNKFT